MRKTVAFVIAIACAFPVTLQAQVVKFDVLERVPAFAGRCFGEVGPYERITARATIALDPADGRNAVIADIALAPRNTDGIAIAGVHLLALAVPRATYTGWNPRAQGYGPTAFYPLQGAVLPFSPTEAARKDANDPRPSIEARYANDDAYVAAVKREAARAVTERLLLEEDAVRSVEAAKRGTLAKLLLSNQSR